MTIDQILTIEEYEKIRHDFRKKVLKSKEERRFEFGPNFTFLFENSLTIQYQIQEMLRIEKRSSFEAIKEEWQAYKDLLPSKRSFSATLLIQYPDPIERKVMLTTLSNLKSYLHISDENGAIKFSFDEKQINPEKISSVQFIKFELNSERLSKLVIDSKHPNYHYKMEVPTSTVIAINEDLNN